MVLLYRLWRPLNLILKINFHSNTEKSKYMLRCLKEIGFILVIKNTISFKRERDNPTFYYSYILTILHSYALTLLHSHILTISHSYISKFLNSYIPKFLHSSCLTFIHSYIHTFLHSYILTFIYS